MDFTMRLVANSVDLRTELLTRRVRILIEQCLYSIMVLFKQRPHLLLLFWRQLQIIRKSSKFLVDRLWRMDIPKLLAR